MSALIGHWGEAVGDSKVCTHYRLRTIQSTRSTPRGSSKRLKRGGVQIEGRAGLIGAGIYDGAADTGEVQPSKALTLAAFPRI